jgi:hypothetical protein
MTPASGRGDRRGQSTAAGRSDLLGPTVMIRAAGERKQAHKHQGEHD